MARASASGQVTIFFEQRGLVPLSRSTDKVFEHMSGRASYYAGLIQTRIGYAFLGASAAITAFAVLGTKRFAEFDQAMKNTASVTDATAEEIKQLTIQAQRLDVIGTASATEIANAMYFLGSAGLEAREIMASIEPIMKLAVGTQYDMAETSRIVAQSLKAFGKEAEEATHFAEVFAAGITGSQLRMEWLGQSMKHLGPVAREMGLSIEETVAVLAMLHDVGVQAGMAGRHFRRILQGTVRDTPQVTKVLTKYNLTLGDLNIKSRGAATVLQTLSQRGVDIADIFKLFGLRASASGAALVNMSKDFSEYMAIVSDTTKLQRMFSIQMSGLQAQFKRLANTFTVMMQQMIKPWKPLLIAVTKVLQKIFSWVAFSPAWVRAILGVVAAVTALSTALLGLTMILLGTLTQGMLSIAMIGVIFSQTWTQSLGVIKAFGTYLKVNFIATITGLNAKLSSFAMKQGAVNAMVTAGTVRTKALSVAYLNLSLAIKAVLIWTTRLTAKFILIGAAAYALLTVLTLLRIALDLPFKSLIEGLKSAGAAIRDEVLSSMGVWIEVFSLGIAQMRAFYDVLEDSISPAVVSFGKKLLNVNPQLAAMAQSFMLVKVAGENADEIMESVAEHARIVAEENVKTLQMIGGLLRGGLKEEVEAYGKLFGDQFDPEIADSAGGKFKTWAEYMQSTSNSLGESFDRYSARIQNTWSDVIFDLVKGTKDWGDVWRMITDDALRTFINGFVKGAMDSFGKMLSHMVFSYHSAQADMGGAGGGGLFGSIAKIATGFLGGGGANAGVAAWGTSGSPIGPRGPSGGFFSGAGFQQGSESIPRDMMAFLHRGERVVPAHESAQEGTGEVTVVNIVDPSFVQSSLARNPSVIVNVINDDLVMAGPTRRTIRRYLS
jgi:TP901 family phage tail tape measure protein